MRTLSVVGTAAMFLVGGGILVHGVPALHHTVVHFSESLGGFTGIITEQSANAVVGIVAGAILLLALTAFQKLKSKA